MKIWAAGSNGVDNANLNSTFPVDAIVDAAVGTASGAIYPTLTAALAAGHRSIYVRTGTYNEAVTIANNYTTIVGEQQVSTSVGGGTGPVFQQTLTVNADFVRLFSLGVAPASGDGIAITTGKGYYSRIYDCAVYAPPGQGFAWGISYDLVFRDCRVYSDQVVGNGFYMAPDTTSSVAHAITLEHCIARNMGGWGFWIEADRTSGAALRFVSLIDCHATACSRAWTSGGFFIGGRDNVDLIGCHAHGCGNSGSAISSSGFRFGFPGTSSPSIFTRAIGCEASECYGIGFNLDSATPRVSLLGCRARGNTTDFVNATSCPGYASGTPAAPFLNLAG